VTSGSDLSVDMRQNAGAPWLIVHTDGASRNNPGPAGAGATARDEDGNLLLEVSEFLGKATNNVAEYYALILMLEACRELQYSRLRVYTDSQLMANQVTGGFRVKHKGLQPLAARVSSLFEDYSEVEVQYIPREKNTECDALANKAIDDGLLGLKEPLLGSGDSTLF
jgi:ribonuclease HI